MQFFWILLVGIGVLALFFMGARITGGARRVTTAGRREAEGRHGRDLGANVNPSQTGNRVDLWPDRTGARTRRELGARNPVNLTFSGEREENHETATGPIQSDPTRPVVQPGIRREAADGAVTPRQGQQAQSDLAPEDEFGEDRPANRTIPPDQPPTQWHPRDHGAPGDHFRDGHHRSATGPERKSDATDPFAHAPVPGPNHVPPESGVEFPNRIRP